MEGGCKVFNQFTSHIAIDFVGRDNKKLCSQTTKKGSEIESERE